MVRRDIAREEVKSRKQIEAASKNAEAQAKADARIATALDAGRQMLQKRREEFDSKQRLNEQRRQYVPECLHTHMSGWYQAGQPMRQNVHALICKLRAARVCVHSRQGTSNILSYQALKAFFCE